MRVYYIFDGMDGSSSYYATYSEAYTARERYFGGEAEIERLTLVDLPPQKLAVLLLNGEAFVAKREKMR